MDEVGRGQIVLAMIFRSLNTFQFGLGMLLKDFKPKKCHNLKYVYVSCKNGRMGTNRRLLQVVRMKNDGTLDKD